MASKSHWSSTLSWCQQGYQSPQPSPITRSAPCWIRFGWCPRSQTSTVPKTSHLPPRNLPNWHIPCVSSIPIHYKRCIHFPIWPSSHHAWRSSNARCQFQHKIFIWKQWATYHTPNPNERSQFKCHTYRTPILQNRNQRLGHSGHPWLSKCPHCKSNLHPSWAWFSGIHWSQFNQHPGACRQAVSKIQKHTMVPQTPSNLSRTPLLGPPSQWPQHWMQLQSHPCQSTQQTRDN